jgi:hypothetical protein
VLFFTVRANGIDPAVAGELRATVISDPVSVPSGTSVIPVPEIEYRSPVAPLKGIVKEVEPSQIAVTAERLITGRGFTTTSLGTLTVLVQFGVAPLSVIEVSVYVVVEAGVTLMVSPVDILLYVSPLITRSKGPLPAVEVKVRFALSPAQTGPLLANVPFGNAPTVIVVGIFTILVQLGVTPLSVIEVRVYVVLSTGYLVMTISPELIPV